jgi:CubicO group peptidase (beta-lactamase class C family)
MHPDIRTRGVAAVGLLAALFCSTVIGSEPVELSSTPGGKRLGEIIHLLNAPGDEEDIKAYVSANYEPGFRDAFPMARHIAAFTATHTMFKHLEPMAVEETAGDEITATLYSETTGAWLAVTLMLEEQEPYRIAGMLLKPAEAPVAAADKADEAHGKGTPPLGQGADAGAPSQDDLPFSTFEEMDRYLSEQADAGAFSGTVLVAKDGVPEFQKAYGYANKQHRIANGLNTKFNLGSINKFFTSAAIAQLIERGKLGLDNPIGTYLEDFPGEVADKVTIKHLLTMRSGWGDYWGNEAFTSNMARIRTVSDYIDFLKDVPLDFEPGTNMQHSNTSFEILGAIIEQVSGLDYFDYIRDNIYKPAGMLDTDSYDRDGPAEDISTGYTNMNPFDPVGEGYQWTNTYLLSAKGSPAGGGYSTAPDMLKFDMALRNHKLLSHEYTDLIFRRWEEGAGQPFVPKRAFGLSAAGGAPGVSTFFCMDMMYGYTVVVLTNYDFPCAMPVGEAIISMLKQQHGR